jgi:hypothetical protein
MSLRMPLTYHGPSSHVGSQLPEKERAMFHAIKADINGLLSDKLKSLRKQIISIVFKFNETDVLGMEESIPLLKQVIKYCRHKVVDTTAPKTYIRLIQLLDTFMRKSGVRAHALIGRKKFLQTVSVTARRFKAFPEDPNFQDAADYTFDCLMAWHEAFLPLKELFPFYSQIYYKLKYKYKVKFLKMENDPSRPTIPLERCDEFGNLVEDRPLNESLFLSESMDSAHNGAHGHQDQHVSYSVYANYHKDGVSFHHSDEDNEEEEDSGEVKYSEELEMKAIENDLLHRGGKPQKSFQIQLDFSGGVDRPKSFRITDGSNNNNTHKQPEEELEDHHITMDSDLHFRLEEEGDNEVNETDDMKRRSAASIRPVLSGVDNSYEIPTDEKDFGNDTNNNNNSTTPKNNKKKVSIHVSDDDNQSIATHSSAGGMSVQDKVAAFNQLNSDSMSANSQSTPGGKKKSSGTLAVETEIRFIGGQRVVKSKSNPNMPEM